MTFGDCYHSIEAFGEDPVVRLDHFDIPRLRTDVKQSAVVVRDLRDEPLVADHSHPRIPPRVFRGNFSGSVGALVIDEQVFEPDVSLRQHALDALTEKCSGVVKGGYDA